ncbi:MAG: NAD(P)-dependent oxidoreductase, partial [Treponema sp.]|nr:NAD(P)-dependent oxidoreductase [Treponema sp.]
MIWLVGDKGMLGKELALLFEKNGVLFTGTDRETDITSAESLKDFAQKLLSAKKGTEPENHWIINCAAYTAVDKAEDDAKTCRLINETGAENLARCAEDTGARLIHLSTDYVFSGKGIPDTFGVPRPYREEDPPDPICVYGRSKRNGETRVRERCGAAYIIRTAWLYGKCGNNFVETMLKLMGERGELDVVNDQRGSPTWAFDLAGIIAAIINAAEKGTDMP